MFRTMSLLLSLLCAHGCTNETPVSEVKYDQDALTCPAADETNRYIEVPAIYDLETFGAKTANINELNLSLPDGYYDYFSVRKFRIFYELHAPIDPAKELVMLIPGGPGGNHMMLHEFERDYPELFEKFNVVAMDHRGVGCSQAQFPGDAPYQSLFMRYAASDIDAIRRELVGDQGKIALIGHSYGTILAQTYALLYPDQLNHLVLLSALGSAEDYRISRLKFEDLATSVAPGQQAAYRQLKIDHPTYAHRFVTWAKRPLYSYKGREQVAKTFDAYRELVYAGKFAEAEAFTQPEIFVMPWMTRSIACVEIFPYELLTDDEFELFPYNFRTCSEFTGNFQYFNYLDDLQNVKARTMVFGGVFDPVTPIESMRKIAAKIPNAYLYQDAHLAHSMEKKACLNQMLLDFLAGSDDVALDAVALTDACQQAPH